MPAHDERVTPGPWPAGAGFGQDGLVVAGVRAADLAERFGTPLFVLDGTDMRARARAFVAAFPRAMYAVKAFTARGVLRAVTEEGMGLLAASGGELEACLRSGASPSAIALHGNNKAEAELEAAVRAGIGLVIVDNPDELERLAAIAGRLGRRQPILFRVIPGVHTGTHRYIETGEEDSKFGTPVAGGVALGALERAASMPELELRGLHVHAGSQVRTIEPFLASIEVALDLAAQARERCGATFDLLDAGGGFPAAYLDDDAFPSLDAFADAILAAVRDGAAARRLPAPEVLVEPGRSIVANAVLTLYEVGSVKTIPGRRTYVAVDGGMSDNIRPILYDARYTVALAGREATGPSREVTVVGKHCESGDVLAEGVALPEDVSPGDLLAFAATGAYGYSMASNYNRVGRPAVVEVRDGRARLLLRRESDDDMDRLEPGEVPWEDFPGVGVSRGQAPAHDFA
jgi:diaminopimelate decarboxylase